MNICKSKKRREKKKGIIRKLGIRHCSCCTENLHSCVCVRKINGDVSGRSVWLNAPLNATRVHRRVNQADIDGTSFGGEISSSSLWGASAAAASVHLPGGARAPLPNTSSVRMGRGCATETFHSCINAFGRAGSNCKTASFPSFPPPDRPNQLQSNWIVISTPTMRQQNNAVRKLGRWTEGVKKNTHKIICDTFGFDFHTGCPGQLQATCYVNDDCQRRHQASC